MFIFTKISFLFLCLSEAFSNNTESVSIIVNIYLKLHISKYVNNKINQSNQKINQTINQKALRDSYKRFYYCFLSKES